METGKSLDAGHFSLLEMIKVIHTITGPAFAKGALIRTGLAAAEENPTVEFGSWEEFLSSIDTIDNPIAKYEGTSKHYGDGVFGLPKCPFAESIRTFTSVAGKLPASYVSVTEQINEPSAMTERLRIGAGAAVSPFCGMHQSVRSELGSTRIKVDGRFLKVTQLGCKAASGKKGISSELCAGAGVDTGQVEKILDENMCCYQVVLE